MLFPAANWPLCMAKTFKGNFKEKKRTEKTPLSFMRFPWEISKSKLFEDSSSPERRRGKDRERQVKRVGKKLFLRNSGGRGKRERDGCWKSLSLGEKRRRRWRRRSCVVHSLQPSSFFPWVIHNSKSLFFPSPERTQFSQKWRRKMTH